MYLPPPVRIHQILESCRYGTPPHAPLPQMQARPPGARLVGRTTSPNSPHLDGLLLLLLEYTMWGIGGQGSVKRSKVRVLPGPWELGEY